MAKIKGKWQWRYDIQEIIWDSVLFPNQEVNFSCQDKSVFFVRLVVGNFGTAIEIFYVGNDGSSHLFMRENRNNPEINDVNEQLRTMDFGDTEQEVSDDFYNFMLKHANYIPLSISDKLTWIAENEQRVYDAGYEKGKAEAVPVLQEAVFTENGEYLPDEGYDGFSKVMVDVEGSGDEVEEILIPHTVYEESYLNGFNITPGTLLIDHMYPEQGYTLYLYSIGNASRLKLSGVRLGNDVSTGTTRENVIFLKNSEQKDAIGMPIDEYAMTSHDILVTPDPWNGANPLDEYVIEVPQGLGIDGVALSCKSEGTPVLIGISSSSQTYDEIFEAGYTEGYNAGFEAGKKSLV